MVVAEEKLLLSIEFAGACGKAGECIKFKAEVGFDWEGEKVGAVGLNVRRSGVLFGMLLFVNLNIRQMNLRMIGSLLPVF